MARTRPRSPPTDPRPFPALIWPAVAAGERRRGRPRAGGTYFAPGRSHVSPQAHPGGTDSTTSNTRLAVLLAMAMFVLVVDTSLMNVSISAVVARPRHDGQRRAVGDRARGARLGRVHPDRQQGRRPHRPQARLRARPARLRRRRAGDGARPEPHRDHRLLGDHRRPRRVAAAARHAVAHPRQLRGRGAEARPTRWSAPRPRSPRRSARCSAASSPPTCPGASRSCSRSS